jgi:transposase-like protein
MGLEGQKFKQYLVSFIMEAIRLHEMAGSSYRMISEHLTIHDVDQVMVWVRKYGQHGEKGVKA